MASVLAAGRMPLLFSGLKMKDKAYSRAGWNGKECRGELDGSGDDL